MINECKRGYSENGMYVMGDVSAALQNVGGSRFCTRSNFIACYLLYFEAKGTNCLEIKAFSTFYLSTLNLQLGNQVNFYPGKQHRPKSMGFQRGSSLNQFFIFSQIIFHLFLSTWQAPEGNSDYIFKQFRPKSEVS